MFNAKPLFQVNYFILRGEAVPRPPPTVGDVDDTTKIKNWLHGENEPHDLVRYCLALSILTAKYVQISIFRLPNVHEQVDGTILGCCATGTSSKDSLLSWVRFLQRDNPDLENIPILFTLNSPLGTVIPVDDNTRGVRANK